MMMLLVLVVSTTAYHQTQNNSKILYQSTSTLHLFAPYQVNHLSHVNLTLFSKSHFTSPNLTPSSNHQSHHPPNQLHHHPSIQTNTQKLHPHSINFTITQSPKPQPTQVIILTAEDDFLKERIKNLPAVVVEGTENEEKAFTQRLEEYRKLNTVESSIEDFLDELEFNIHFYGAPLGHEGRAKLAVGV